MKKLIVYFWKEHVILFFILIFLGLSTLCSSLLYAEIVNSLITFNYSKFLLYVLFLLCVFIFILLFTYLEIVYSGYLTQKISKFLRLKIINKISKAPYEIINEKKPLNYISWFTTDIDQIEKQTIAPFYNLLKGIISAIISAITLFLIHWYLLLLTIFLIIILLQIPKFFGKKLENKNKELSNNNEKFVSKVTDCMSAYNTVFSFRKFGFIIRKISKASDYISDTKNDYQKIMALVAICGGFVNLISQISIFVLTGYLSLMGLVSVGTIVTTTSLAGEIFNTFGNISQYISMINSTKPIFEKIDSLVEVSTYRDITLEKDSSRGIYLSDFSLILNNKKILNNVNYKFEVGKKYGIIGKSGSGKSSLLNVIGGRIKNYEGSLLVNNVELSKMSYDDIFDNMIYIDQKPYIFDSSIRENLCLGDNFSNEQITNVLEILMLKDVVLDLPDGLDTIVSEKNTVLSGGQLQRLAIARGLLRNKKIMLLDEVTANLDYNTAKSIELDLIRNTDVTIIMVSHHFSDSVIKELDGILEL